MTEEKPRRGIQSIEIGTSLLLQLARKGQPMPLREIARGAGISIGKAHPYLVSFSKVGFVIQDASGCYELGPLALQLGLVRLQRLDALKEAGPLVEALALQTGLTVSVCVWGNLGPTVVRIEQPAQPLHIALRVGTVLSVIGTATGRLFASFLPGSSVNELVARDMSRFGGVETQRADLPEPELARLIEETRERGLSRTVESPIPGINALSAPVFDATGKLALAVTAIGPAASFDVAWDGEVAKALLACALGISERLGHRVVGA